MVAYNLKGGWGWIRTRVIGSICTVVILNAVMVFYYLYMCGCESTPEKLIQFSNSMDVLEKNQWGIWNYLDILILFIFELGPS